MRVVLKWFGILLAVLVMAVAVFIAVFDWNWIKDYVASKGSELTGRNLTIDDLDVNLSWRPLVTVQGLHFENASWSKDSNMVEIEQLQFRIVLIELLKLRMVLPELSFIEPRIVLEKSKQGEPNWEVTADGGSVSSDRSEFPIIGQLTIDDGRIIYRDPGQGMDITAVIATATGKAGKTEQLVNIQGQGWYQGEPFKLTMTAGSLLDLRETDKPYPLNLKVTVGDTEGKVDGTLTEPLALKGVDLALSLQGQDPAKLFPILGIPIPNLPPYKVEGRLSRQKDTWMFKNFAGKVGDSDLAGDVAVDTGGERKFLRANLVSDKLNFDDLGGLVGAQPKAGEEETVSQEQQQQAAESTETKRILPDSPLDLQRIRAMDAAVKFKGKQVIAPKLPLDNVTANLELKDGHLTFKPLNFGIGNGDIRSEIAIDGRKEPVESSITAEVAQVNLKDLLARFEIAEESIGTIGGRGTISGKGTSIARFLGSANGNFSLIMTGGKLDSLLVELAGLDIGEALVTLTTKERNIPIRCVVTNLKMQDGVAAVQTLVIDTTDTTITGEGSINFKDETLDLVLEPHPKDVSILSARSPLDIKGTFKEPSFAPEVGSLAARGAAAAALGVLLTPLAALAALVEPGSGEDADCHALIDRATR